MRCIGVAGGVPLYSLEDSYISYFNSPYIGHRRCSAIDIYPPDSSWDSSAFSPIDGKIVEVRELSMGKKKVFPSSPQDYAIALAPEGVEDVIVRILHCQPDVSVGDKVSKGDLLGGLIRSRYFCYWTGPHYHVEVMHPIHITRPSQSFPIRIEETKVNAHNGTPSSQFECEVVSCTKDIIVCTSRELSFAENGEFYGHLASTERAFGFLDAGVPHYKNGGIIGGCASVAGSQVQAWNGIVGCVSSFANSICQFEMEEEINISLDGVKIRGISTHLYSKKQIIHGQLPIFLIPEQYGQFEGVYAVGDRAILTNEK